MSLKSNMNFNRPKEAWSSESSEALDTHVQNHNKLELISDEELYSPKIREFLKMKNYINAVLVRIIFIGLSSYQVYFLACIYNQPLYFMIYSYYAILCGDCFWVIWKRAGCDYYWFSISFAAYIANIVILIVLQMDFKYYQEDIHCETNRTVLSNLPLCKGTSLSYTICDSVEMLVISFLASLVIARWLLPQSKRMPSHVIYTQIAGFITLAADLIEIAEYMQNDQVAVYYSLMKMCQVIFGLGLFQFSFSLVATKKRNMSLVGWRRLIDILFATEAWSLAFAVITQELPCFGLRIALIFTVLANTNYALYFFVFKNALMMVFLTFQIIFIVWMQIQVEKKIKPG